MKLPFHSMKDYFFVKKRTLVILLVLVAAGVALYYVLTHEDKPKKEVALVRTMPVEQRDVNIYGEYVGRIRAQQFVEVHARVEGYLERMTFEEGTFVKKGQVLFVIDPRQYQAKADKAKAQL